MRLHSTDAKINPISYRTLIKPFISRTKQFKRNLRHGFAERNTAEDNNAKINVFPNIPCTFLLFKACAFLQNFFPSNLPFRQVLRPAFFSIVNVYLKTSNKRTHIPLFINQFVSLVELKT